MNSIFLDTLKDIKRERPPVWFMRQAGRALPSYQKLKDKYEFSQLMREPELAAEVTLLPVHDLKVDAAILFSDILVVPQALGMSLGFSNKGPKFITPLKDIQDPEKILNPNISQLEHIFKAITIVKQKEKNIPLIGFCGGPLTVLCYMWDGDSLNNDFPNTLNLIYSDTNKLLKITELISNFTIEYINKQIDSGIDAFQLFESSAGLIPWEIYSEIFLPFTAKIINSVLKRNIPVIFFPRGIGCNLANFNQIKDKYQLNGFNCVGLDWHSNLETVRQILGKSWVIQGNLDPRMILNPNFDTKKMLKSYHEFGKKDKRWIFNLGHGVLPQTPVKNLEKIVEWIKTENWVE